MSKKEILQRLFTVHPDNVDSEIERLTPFLREYAKLIKDAEYVLRNHIDSLASVRNQLDNLNAYRNELKIED